MGVMTVAGAGVMDMDCIINIRMYSYMPVYFKTFILLKPGSSM